MLNIEKNLTARLRMIADLVPSCETLCDIGTDHGYVAIYLAKKNIAKKIIAADIKEGPLKQAEKNITIFGESSKIKTRLSDGFSAIKEGEAQCAVIAGMGGETIASILENEKGCQYFVLQMQTGHRHLREYLQKNGYVIEKEALCREGRKMYCALRALRGKMPSLSEAELEIGPYLIEHKPPLFNEYIDYRLYEINTILKSIRSSSLSMDREKHYINLKNEYERLKQ